MSGKAKRRAYTERLLDRLMTLKFKASRGRPMTDDQREEMAFLDRVLPKTWWPTEPWRP